MKVGLSVIAADSSVRWHGECEDEVTLAWRGRYEEGDALLVEADSPEAWLWMQLDICLAPSLVLLRGGRLVYPIPDSARQVAYGKGWAFADERHWARVRAADPRELSSWGNLALNSHDLNLGNGKKPHLFPHAETNVTCDNPQFWARNAIDGICSPSRHGSWPHGSWGIAGRKDAELTIEFGTPVVADELRVWLRADFPHDGWWREATLVLSDGTQTKLSFEKTGERQAFALGGSVVSWLRLEGFVQAEPGFPALSQVEVWGTNACEEEQEAHA